MSVRAPLLPIRLRVPWSKGLGIPSLAVALAMAGCASPGPYPGGMTAEEFAAWQQQQQQAAASTPSPTFSYWEGAGVPGEASIIIDLSEQAAYFYRDERVVGRSRVATGRSGFATPTGDFRILEKTVDKNSNLYGRIYDADGSVVNSDADIRTDAVPEGGKFVGASMPFWMRVTNSGVGMHSGPIPNPGRPASHGCIRLPRNMAETFFANVEIGTPVTIRP